MVNLQVQRLPGKGTDPLLMSLQSRMLLSSLGIPDNDQSIHASRGKILSVGAPGNVLDPVSMTLQLMLRRLCVQIPDANGGITSSRSQHGATRRELDTEDCIGVTSKRRRAAGHGSHTEDSLGSVNDLECFFS